MRPALAFLALLTLAACGGDDAAEAPLPVAVPAASGDTSAPDSLLGDVQIADEPATIKAMAAGDYACTLTVQDGGGSRDVLAEFNFCERDDLMGRAVMLTTAPAQIPAASCAGDPACTDTESVRLVVAADPVDDLVGP